MTKNVAKNIVVIGAGPGGYVCAIRAAQLGHSVTVIDEMSRPGGTCLNMGCIPSKNLLQATHEYQKVLRDLPKFGIEAKQITIDIKKMQAQKNQVINELGQGIQFLFKKNNIRFVNAKAELLNKNQVKVADEILNADAIVIATGSLPRTIKNISMNEATVLSSKGALELQQAPKSLAIIGGGYIGLELGSVWGRLGTEIHVIETMERIVPGLDSDLSQSLHTVLEKQGFNFHMKAKIKEVNSTKGGAEIFLGQNGQEQILNVEKVLVSVGRMPNTSSLNLEKIGVEITSQGFIKVDESLETTCKGIYAIGDVVEGPMLAHKAEEEGVAVAEHLSGMVCHVDYNVIPAVVFTQPEVASVGFTESQLQLSNVPYKVSKFPFSANSRAKAVHETFGFVKLLCHQESGLVLGAHIIGSCAGAMIAQVAQAMKMRATAEDIVRTCHAHPTYSEAIKEAALGIFSRAIHS
jgi:dihydrolipoamide dehydrogenase